MSATKGRHPTLDLVRGLAAVGVAIYHWRVWHGLATNQSLSAFGVYIFFVLSALTMAMVYSKRFEEQISREAVRNFYQNRLARVLPLLILVTITTVSFYSIGGLMRDDTLPNGLLTATGFIALAAPGHSSVTAGAWSLGIELMFYTITPLVLLLAKSLKNLVFVCITLVITQQIYIYSISNVLDPIAHWDLYVLPLTFCPYFAIGLLIFKLGGSRRLGYLWITLTSCALIAGFSLLIPVDITRNNLAHLALMFSVGFTVYAANRTRLSEGMTTVAVILGEISYALYLTHRLTYILIDAILRKLGWVMSATGHAFLSVSLACIVAFATFTLFERPVRDWLRATDKSTVATLP